MSPIRPTKYMPYWNYSKSVPQEIFVACSGGVDSVAAAVILSEWRNVTLLHFSHSDNVADKEIEVVKKLSNRFSIPLLTKSQDKSQSPGNSEEQWRVARYEWFNSFDTPVVTGHTLDDAVEWYLMTCLRGRGEYMPIENNNVFRPFLFTEKKFLIQYAESAGLEWFEDPGNADPEFSLRSNVRKNLVPAALLCEPSLKNMVKKRLIEKYK